MGHDTLSSIRPSSSFVRSDILPTIAALSQDEAGSGGGRPRGGQSWSRQRGTDRSVGLTRIVEFSHVQYAL